MAPGDCATPKPKAPARAATRSKRAKEKNLTLGMFAWLHTGLFIMAKEGTLHRCLFTVVREGTLTRHILF
jgi:hypothetical protein